MTEQIANVWQFNEESSETTMRELKIGLPPPPRGSGTGSYSQVWVANISSVWKADRNVSSLSQLIKENAWAASSKIKE